MPPNLNGPPKPSAADPRSGYVYFLDCQGFTKIGITTDLSMRLCSLQGGNPFEIEVLGVIETDHIQKLELELHRKFEAYHVRGEWFKIPSWMLMEISRQFSKERIHFVKPNMRKGRPQIEDEV